MPDRFMHHRYIGPLKPIPTGAKTTLRFKGTIQCILFDIYGTLFISKSGDISMMDNQKIGSRHLSRLLSTRGISMEPEALILAFTSAIKKKHQEMMATGVDYPEVQQDRIWMQVLDWDNLEDARNFALEFETIVNSVYPMPNVKETISALKQSGICLGVISNAQFYTDYLFDWFFKKDLTGLGFHPELIFYSYRYGYAKPSMFMFEKAKEVLANMGIPHQATLYVGNDMLNDMVPAKTVGFKTCLFAGDQRSLRMREDNPGCMSLRPDMVITDLFQIIRLLKGAAHGHKEENSF